MHYPAELYSPSARPYRDPEPPKYPFYDRTVCVTRCGRTRIGRRKIDLSTLFAGQNVGVKEIEENIWLVTFMNYDLGFFDHETGRIECAENPFSAKVSAVSSGQRCLRKKMDTIHPGRTLINWRARRDSNSRPPGS